MLDKLHKRDRRAREKAIAEYAREAFKGAGLLHLLTKPRCGGTGGQELVAHRGKTPNGEDMAVLPQLEVDGPSGFDVVVGSFKAKRALVSMQLIPPCGRASQKRGEQLYTDLFERC